MELGPGWVLWIGLVLNVMWFGIAFAAGFVVLQILARPWRRSIGLHWSERARLAYTAGTTVLFLAVILAGVVGLAGNVVLEVVTNRRTGTMGLAGSSMAVFAGVMMARYLWLRELWGPRVTVRSWLAGCLVLFVGFMPGLAVTIVLVFTLPVEFGARAVITFAGRSRSWDSSRWAAG